MKRAEEKGPPTHGHDERTAPHHDAKGHGASAKEVDALRARIKELEDERDRARHETAELREKHLRARADYDNLAKRTAKDSQDTVRAVKSGILLRLANLVETLDTLAQDLEKRLGADAKGVKMVLDEAQRFLKDEGVREIPGRGQPFNYRFHQAVERVETTDSPDGTIVDVVQRGYQWGDDVLRPALVKVAAHPRAPARTEAATGPT